MRKLLPLLLLFCITSSATAIKITEIMYQPTQKDTYNEWIEIYSESSVSLSSYTLCGKPILAGYVNRDKIVQNDAGLSLQAGQYAIITDGGSGTEVYNNFDVSDNAISLSVDASSLCNTLTNSGKTITIEFDNTTIDTVTYSPDIGGAGDGNSLQFYENTWRACAPTPGSSNSCGNTTEPKVVANDTSEEEPTTQSNISPSSISSLSDTQTESEPVAKEDLNTDANKNDNFVDGGKPELIYPKAPSQQDTAHTITQGTSANTPSGKATKISDATMIYSKTNGNINFAVFMLLFISVILNVIFIFVR